MLKNDKIEDMQPNSIHVYLEINLIEFTRVYSQIHGHEFKTVELRGSQAHCRNDH